MPIKSTMGESTLPDHVVDMTHDVLDVMHDVPVTECISILMTALGNVTLQASPDMQEDILRATATTLGRLAEIIAEQQSTKH